MNLIKKTYRFVSNFRYYLNSDHYDDKDYTGQDPKLKTRLRVFWAHKFDPTREELIEEWRNFKPEGHTHDINRKSADQHQTKNGKRKTLVLPTRRQSQN